MTGDELPDLGDMPTLEDIAEEYAHLARQRAAILVKYVTGKRVVWTRSSAPR
jgi:hypothetical protein